MLISKLSKSLTKGLRGSRLTFSKVYFRLQEKPPWANSHTCKPLYCIVAITAFFNIKEKVWQKKNIKEKVQCFRAFPFSLSMEEKRNCGGKKEEKGAALLIERY